MGPLAPILRRLSELEGRSCCGKSSWYQEALWTQGLSGESLVNPLFLRHSLLLSSIQPRSPLKAFHFYRQYLEAKKASASQGSESLSVAVRYAYAAW